MTYRLTDSDLELIRNVDSSTTGDQCSGGGQASCRMETVGVLVAKKTAGLNSRAGSSNDKFVLLKPIVEDAWFSSCKVV